MSTLTQITATVRELTGVYAPSLVSDALIAMFANEVYHEINGLAPWPWLTHSETITTSDGALLPSPPAGSRVRQLRRVLRDGSELPQLHGTVAAEPHRRGWRLDEERVAHLVNVDLPAEVEVQAAVALDDLTGPDTPVWPSEYHNAIAYGAAARVLDKESDETDRAERYEARATAIIERMRREAFGSQASTPVDVRGVPSPRSGWRRRGR